MKTLQNCITEKILINKNSKIAYNYHPKTKDKLKYIINKRIKYKGNACDLNDIHITLQICQIYLHTVILTGYI